MLVLLFVEQQLSFDEFHEKSDRIYRVIHDRKDKNFNMTISDISPLWGPILKMELPEIIEMTRIMTPLATGAGEIIIEHENKFLKEQNPLFVDANIFQVFDIKLEKGNPETALAEPRSIVLSKDMANKYFVDEDPVGKTLSLNMWINFISDNPDGFDPNGEYLITGVARNLPLNSHFHFDYLISFSSIKFWEMYNMDLHTIFGINTYLVLPEGYSQKELETKMNGLVKKYLSSAIEKTHGISYDEFQAEGMYYRYRLQKLTDIYLGSGHMRSNKKLGTGGEGKDIYFYALIALAILIIASINFINISTAQLGSRTREVGLRKVVGSHRSKLIQQFLLESIFISFCALFLATLVAIVSLKTFNQFIQPDLSIQNFTKGWIIPGIIGLTLIVGLMAGTYPSFLFSKLQPAALLKNPIKSASGGLLFRNGLVIFQFSVSVIFIVASLVVYSQLSYIRAKPLGFNKEHVITVHNTGTLRTGGPVNEINRVEAYKQELSRNSNILSVSGSTGRYGFLASNPSLQYFIPEGKTEEEKVRLGCQIVDRNVFETFGLDVIAMDEDIADLTGEAMEIVVLNEAAVKHLNLTDPIGKTMIRHAFNRTCKIAGVVKDFHFQSLQQAIQPYILILVNRWGPLVSIRSVYIRINPEDIPNTLEYIKNVSEQFMPGQPFEYSFLDEDVDRYYHSERQLGKLFGFLSGIAVILSYLGIFGLSSYMLHKRTKEIAIRKILGASIQDIILLLSKQYLILALIAFILAIPVSYFLMDKWLQEFAYRININLSSFVFSILIILIILIFAVGRQTIKSAISNPVDAVKYE